MVSLSALTRYLDGSLDLFADVVLNPSFPAEDFARRKKQLLSAIEAEKSQPIGMAIRVLPELLYGAGHAYGNPLSGSGTRASVESLTRDSLIAFHRTWFKPNNATLIVVGDTTMAEIKPKLESLFRKWKKGKVPEKNIAPVDQKSEPQVYLVDKPGAIQSIIIAGHVAPPRSAGDEIAIETMNTILGGTFVSRLNMNLREDKHWTYGARTLLLEAEGQRPFLAFAPVQTDRTSESVIEILKELRGVRGDRPFRQDELDKIREKNTLELPGLWETNGAVAGSIAEIVRYELDDRYFDGYANRVRSLNLQQISDAAREVVHPDNVVWLIVGDREQVEAGLRELELGKLLVIDADGRPVD